MSSPSVQPVLALLAHPLGGNPTQYMVEKAFAHHQLDWRYLSLEVTPDDLGDAVRGLKALGFRGGNCARPHRQHVAKYLDRVGRTAELAGAVNCILTEEGKLVGENTEGQALVAALKLRTDPAGKRIVLLGSGELARAIAVELAAAKAAEIAVLTRQEEPGRQLVELLEGQLDVPSSLVLWDDFYQLSPETDVLVNASTDMSDTDKPLPLEFDELSAVVADVTSNFPNTWLLSEARNRGCETIDGLETLVGQAVINLKLWTGVDADATVMYEAVEEFLEL